MKTIAIIPARGGSKGVPNKNIIEIDGKPLIEYTIETALAASKVDKVIVSSDSEDILNVARKFDGVAIHKRLDALATDTSPITDTISNILKDESEEYEAFMILQPTSPIRTSLQVDEAVELLSNNKHANSLISVTAMDDVHPARMYWKDNQDDLSTILGQYEETRRQDIPNAYYRNGAIYITNVAAFLAKNSVMIKPSVGYEMPSSQLLNIDEPRDVLIAEVLIKEWKKGNI